MSQSAPTRKYASETHINEGLDFLLQMVSMDTQTYIESGDLSLIAKHFQYVRDLTKEIKSKVDALQKHVEMLSQETLPTLLLNKGMKTINFVDVGRVTINQRYSAQMIDPVRAIAYLKENGNGGVVRETVHHETLGAMAKDAAAAGKPLPDDLFRVGTSNYTSITKI